jgi:cytoskeletal protein RodZ
MFSFRCNLDKSERRNRAVIGAVMILAVIMGFGHLFFLALGAVLIFQSYIGWCAIPVIMKKIKPMVDEVERKGASTVAHLKSEVHEATKSAKAAKPKVAKTAAKPKVAKTATKPKATKSAAKPAKK